MVLVGILFVLGIATISVLKSWKRAKELGYETSQIMKVVKASATFTVVPSIAIVVGFFSIAAMLGVPWPWWRLSVIGSVTYEIMASNMALGAAGVELSTATGADFILVMFVMTIGIMGGLIMVPFLAEKIHNGSMNMKEKDPRWGPLGNSVFMIAIIIAFVVPMFFDGIVGMLTLITSILVSYILSTLVRKFQIKWLSEFVLVFTMLISMASSVLWTALFV